MQTQRNELNFEGQNIFIGIDVHLKSWNVSIFTEHLHHKTFNQSASAELLSNYLGLNFPGANYYPVQPDISFIRCSNVERCRWESTVMTEGNN
ncbi:MAG: hypothetical protein WCK78_17165 [Paludibacter sp.]